MSMKDLVWFEGKIVDKSQANTFCFNQGMNYGACIYDGIRIYTTPKGPAIFRLEEHLDRFFYSAKTLRMELGYSQDELRQNIFDLAKANYLSNGYIRPMAFYSEPKMGVNIFGTKVSSIIINWDWDESVKSQPVTVKISKYERLSPKNVDLSAKIAGYYSGGLLSYIEAKEAGYDLPLILDSDGNIAEGAVNNFFVVKNGKIFTPKSDNILNGITRDTILKVLPDLGIEFEEITMSPDFLPDADEAFLTGTGLGLLGINQVDDKFTSKSSELTEKIQEYLVKICHGQIEKYQDWLTLV